VTVAIVGSGLAGLTAYATLRHGGVSPEEIVVFGDRADPAEAWRERARGIRQTRMRSESDGHVAATSFPGLAVRSAWRRKSVAPLVRSVAAGYNPSVDEFLEHVEDVRVRSGWNDSFVQTRVERVRAVEGGFVVEAPRSPSDTLSLGVNRVFAHVLLAPGHPGLAIPPELADDPRAVHAYAAHDYADDVEVVGAGMAAATEWLNALAAGASVVSVRRREPERRPLNLPRALFTRRGLASYHRAAREEKLGLLRRFSTPSYPAGRAWDEPVERAARAGRFRVAAELNGAAQVICATGFKRGYAQDPLLRRLVDEHALETAGEWIVLAPDSTVPGLTDGTRTLALAGIAAQWAFPGADTVSGAKYAARCFLGKVQQCRTR
jgi:cation diffusion facilitator CzcD-associated flavoprotein CzcO